MLATTFATIFGTTDQTIPESEYQFIAHIAQNGLRYATKAEYQFRLNLFQEKLAFVEEWNADSNNTHTLEMNQFAAWTQEELAQLTGYKPEMNPIGGMEAE